MTMGTPSAAPGPPAPDGTVTVTESDSGRTVHLRVGQRLRVVLGGKSQQWRRPASSSPLLRRIAASGGYPTGRRAEALFAASRPGAASVTSMTDYPCLHAQPPCAVPQRVWSVHVLIANAA